MLIDGVKCNKLTHLKCFILNTAKNFLTITVSQILVESAEVWRGKNHFRRDIAPPCPP